MKGDFPRTWLPLRANEIGLALAIVVVVLLTTAIDAGHTYWNDPGGSAAEIVRQGTMLGIFALGAAVVIISGGIDLSVGSMIAFSATICATILVVLAPDMMDPAKAGSGDAGAQISWSVISIAIAGTVFVGFLVGTFHTWLITTVNLPPFIATLATLVGLRSFARAICAAVTERYLGGNSTQINYLQDTGLRYLGTHIWVPAAVFAVLAVLIWILLSRTVIGRHIYALGGNEQAAKLSGIRTDRVKWLSYCISSMVASVAGVLYFAQVGVAEPQTLGIGEELNAIAAAVVGGCSLQGGVGTIPGTVLGVLFLRCVIDGIAKIIKTGADVYEGLIVGIVVVIAVAFSQLRGATQRGKEFFPGALGWISIGVLGLFTGSLAMVMVAQLQEGVLELPYFGLNWKVNSQQAALAVGGLMLLVLVSLKLLQGARANRARLQAATVE
jgi:ribose/xylose/arabinose/galactoside ABC-type transport system permease subunit